MDKQIFLQDLPRKGEGNQIDWKNSVGFEVKGYYNDTLFTVKILNYIVKTQTLVIGYQDKKLDIKTNHFMRCKLGKLFKYCIWDTDRWMVDLGVSEEDAKRYTYGSSQKIMVNCPDCGRKKRMFISNIYKYRSICCKCKGGMSYAERFVLGVLNQLDVEFEEQYSPKWVGRRFYDFYLPKYNMIIETHGIQHYEDSSGVFKRTLAEEQENDRIKKELALANGIEHYIIIDCRKSEFDWVYFNICQRLKLHFDLTNVDFEKVGEFALKSLSKEIWDYWNNKQDWETTITITNNNPWGIKRSETLVKYLKEGDRLGFCNYNSKEEMKKSALKVGKLRCKPIEVFKGGVSLGIFESATQLEVISEERFGVKLFQNSISRILKDGDDYYKGFVFKYV